MFFILVLLLPPGGHALRQQSPLNSCFCHLGGHIDDCLCSVDTVDHFNNQLVFPRLDGLLRRPYFRYFAYDADRECPFWGDDGSDRRCASPGCGVRPCGRPEEVDDFIGEDAREQLRRWHADDRCDGGDGHCPDCRHVDLTLNPERFTGFAGEASRKIWAAIYGENCFWPEAAANRGNPFAELLQSSVQKLCLEERTFFRLVSGLHASITVHLCANHASQSFSSPLTCDAGGPNLSEFHRRFDPASTNNQGPFWLKNLYFVFLLGTYPVEN